MRGRKPQPTVLRVLRGNPGKRALNKDEPDGGDLDVACPEELTSELSRREWERTIVPAILVGQIRGADRTHAIGHCELWATWREQILLASTNPHVVKAGKQDYPIPNPARMMANKTLQILLKIDAELGFTPTSRSRVTGNKPSSGRTKIQAFMLAKGRAG